MIVEQVEADDWQRARAARLGALAGSPPGTFSVTLNEAARWDEQQWRQWLDRRTIFVAESAADVIGCAGGLLEAGAPYLVSMFVGAPARGTGVSDRLVEAVADWARADGHEHLRLWVVVGNTPAETLYRRIGFEPTGRSRHANTAVARDEYEMIRAL